MITLFARTKKKNGSSPPSPGAAILREIFTGKRRREVQGIAWWALALLLGAAFWPHAAGRDALGPAGEVLFRAGFALCGVFCFALPLAAAVWGLLVFRDVALENPPAKALGLGLGAWSLLVLIQLVHPQSLSFEAVPTFYASAGLRRFWESLPQALRLWGEAELPAGGVIGRWTADLLVTVFSVVGTYIISGALLVIALYLLEMETRFFATVRGLFGGARSREPKVRTLPLDYAAAPARGQERTAAGPAASAKGPVPTRPKINLPPARPAPAAPRPRADERSASGPLPETEAVPFTPSTAPDARFDLPALDLLVEPRPNPELTPAYFEGMSQTLETALGQFGVSAKVVEVCPGPVVTRYELQPAPGVKVNRILALDDDIALAMKAEHVRIEAPIPGKGAVGIELPNREKQVVVLKEMLADPAFRGTGSVLTFAVGKDIGGAHVFARLESMPHLLIAGATGSGKSACINAILCSLLYQATPREVRFLLIDPKRVELTVYNGIPHLKAPVITDAQQAAMALKLLVKEMEDRYKTFAAAGVRDILAYNQALARGLPPDPAELETPQEAALATADGEPRPPAPPKGPMPYILVFIDELADLMMIAANEVENSVTRLAQMARGVGIHLVLATQRPSVDIITGVIKANFPSRIAFQVSSKVDSRTILDANGADALLGRGDMLYSPASASKPLRVQGVFVTTPEVERLVAFWKGQGAPVFDPAFADGKLKAGVGAGANGDEEQDELYGEAVDWVKRAKQASTSLLQRRLKIGYSRAARLLDRMEREGVVGPPDGSKPRKVLVDVEYAADGVGEDRP